MGRGGLSPRPPGGAAAAWPGRDDVLVFDADMPVPDQHALHRALEATGQTGRVFRWKPRYEKYAWYDRLTRIVKVETIVEFDDGSANACVEGSRAVGRPLKAGRPKSITFHVATEDAGGGTGTISLPADLAFGYEEAGRCPAEAETLVTADSTIGVGELTDIIVKAYSCTSDDAESDNWTSQKSEFEEDSRHEAIRLLRSPEDAARDTLTDWARRVRAHVPAGLTATLRITDGSPVEVELHPSPNRKPAGNRRQR